VLTRWHSCLSHCRIPAGALARAQGSLGERLQFQAGLPMQPRRGQKPLDIGFWDPMRDQLELF